MIRLLVEIVAAVGLSLFVGASLGLQDYIVTGAIIAAICATVIYVRQGFLKNIDSAPTLIWIAMTLGICIVLGILWPAIPVIFFYERHKTKRYHEREQL